MSGLLSYLVNELSNPLISLLIGFLLGILGSWIWSRIQAHIVPKVDFNKYVTQIRSEETESGYKDRIQFWNAGRRKIIDTEIFVRLKIKNLAQNPRTSGNFTFFSVPPGYSRLPIMIPERAKEKKLKKEMSSPRHKVRLDVSAIEEFKGPFADYIINKFRDKNDEFSTALEARKTKLIHQKEALARQNKAPSQILIEMEALYVSEANFLQLLNEQPAKLTSRELIQKDPGLLRHLMSLGDEAWLEVAIFGYDGYSGTRKVFTHIYKRDDLKYGFFQISYKNN